MSNIKYTTERFERALKVMQSQQTKVFHTTQQEDEIRKLIELVEKHQGDSKEVVLNIHSLLNQMIVLSNIFTDNTVEISPDALILLMFHQRKDLTKDASTDCWQCDDLFLFETAGWAIGIGNPPIIGNEYIATVAELNNIYKGKYGKDLLSN